MRRKLGSQKLPRDDIKNYKRLRLFSSVYTIQYFTAVISLLDLVLRLGNDPRYINNPAY